MTRIKATVLKKDNKNEFVILLYEDFIKIQKALEDYEDLKILRKAKRLEAKVQTISLCEAKKQWSID